MDANTTVVVTSTLGEGSLMLRSLRMTDALSRPYELELELLATRFDLPAGDLIGTGMGVRFTRPDGSTRDFHGVVSQVETSGATGRFAVYRASLRPALWFLKDAVDSRVFQNQTVPQIVKEGVLKAQGVDDIDDRLTATYASREYCVQYGESDLDFAQRLLEEEGIYYYFRHAQDKHTLVLCDSPQAHADAGCVEYRPQSLPSFDAQEGISEWCEVREVAPAAVAVADYDCTKPKVVLSATSTSAPSPMQKREHYEYPAGFIDNSAGEGIAKVRREALQAARQRFRGAGNPFAVGVGCKFSLASHERLAAAYAVTQATHAIDSHEFEHGSLADAPSFRLASTYTAIPADTPYHPPRITPRATMRGPQTAIVQGPSGQEINVDAMGRVKIKFFWDRLGKDDDTASCWVRVSQGSAGKHWGHMVIPRVGEEVIVDFLDGNPDRPIITGRVYNADHTVPYDLPDNKTRSTLKTRSTPNGGDDNFNELRFEDKMGEEEIYFHAERDFRRVVENNDVLQVGSDKKDKGDQTIEIYNNQTVSVGTGGCADGSQQTTVWKDRVATVKTGDDKLTIEKGSRTTKVAENDTLTVQGGDRSVKIEAGKYTLQAAVSITLEVGENSITIDQSGITLKGTQIKIDGQVGVKVQGLQVQVQATTALDLSALCTKVDSEALLTMKGALVQIN